MSGCALDDDVVRNAGRDADAGAEQPDNERVAVTNDFDLAADAQSHRHQPLDGDLAGLDALDCASGARCHLVEPAACGVCGRGDGGFHHGVTWSVLATPVGPRRTADIWLSLRLELVSKVCEVKEGN